MKIKLLMGIGDWGLGIGPIPNPQSPIPNPQSLIINFKDFKYLFIFLLKIQISYIFIINY